jgi:hypothetical protein
MPHVRRAQEPLSPLTRGKRLRKRCGRVLRKADHDGTFATPHAISTVSGSPIVASRRSVALVDFKRRVPRPPRPTSLLDIA